MKNLSSPIDTKLLPDVPINILKRKTDVHTEFGVSQG